MNTTTQTQTGPAAATAKFKVLAADKLDQQGLDYIESQTDAELANKPGLSEEELAAIAGEHDAMIVRSGVQVTRKVLENPGRLKVVARAGVGVDNIDLAAATEKGILVVNTAEANTITTAEHALALMLGAARQLGPAYQAMAQGGWDRSKFKGRQMAGKTLGVVGFGRIGRTIAERALAFDMKVIAYDPFINAETAMDGRVKLYKKFTDLIPHADVLTFHVPLNDQTRGMLNAETFPQCRDGVIVVNASRGGVVDEHDLVEAIESGKCGGAGLDVFTDEPPAEDSPLRNHPKILTTPHLGASTVEAQQAVSIDAAAACLAYLRGEGVKGAVNAAGLRLDLSPIQQRYAELAERMAALVDPFLSEGVSSVNCTVSGHDLASAAEMIERTTLVGLLQNHLSDPVNLINVQHIAEQRGIDARTVKHEEDRFGSSLAIEVKVNNESHRIVGRVYDDMKPRVVEIDGYHMDMIPAGDMLVLLNEDKPGMIGMVGNAFGQAEVNIADMTISRREANGGKTTAMMVLKLDGEADKTLIKDLERQPGILRVAQAQLAPEPD